jgi:multidrug resistance efflux pump
MADYVAGLRILSKIAEEDRNWRSGLSQIQELLTAAQDAQTFLHQIEGKRAELAALTTKQATVQRMIDDRQRQLTGFEADLAVKEQRAHQRLDELDAQIQAKETKLAVAEKRLDDLKTHLHN